MIPIPHSPEARSLPGTNHPRAASRGGFTLIELLVAITIIVLLIGMLLPMVLKARIFAHRAGCMSNMRQIGMMTIQYCDEHNDKFPAYFPNHPNSAGGLYGATSQLQEYLPECGNRVYVCPASLGKPLLYNDTDPAAIKGGAYAWNGGREGCSYGWNEHLRARRSDYLWYDTGPTGMNAAGPSTVSQVASPSITYWIVDSASARFDRGGWGRRLLSGYRHGGKVPQLTGSWPNPEMLSKPGAAGFNALMVDGHAQWVKWSSNWSSGEHVAWD
ncbi:MAG: type II secretion system protein [Planctomycetes bacterium]|nr:type II secretion system protein [Planctomycetota bacterium]